MIRFVQQTLRGNINSIRHLMTQMGWHRHDVKWDGVDYARGIWIAPGCSVYRGELVKPDRSTEMIGAHLKEREFERSLRVRPMTFVLTDEKPGLVN